MVLPGEELTVNICHIGMRNRNIVMKIETVNALGEKMTEGSAEVSQPTTAYIFTGQGSHSPESPAAHAVLDGNDKHLCAVYGFSILEIVKDNPKEETIHFGGIKGQATCQCYMDTSYYTIDKDSYIKTLPLHPNSLLFATQFTQIAPVVTEKAAFKDSCLKVFIENDCAFAGNSPGEYSALASIADALAISAVVNVIFY
ncbi:hypothetical protein GYMLUDRAFT_253014 [Collybiopsis luxurians FD-317 M1]|uniref:Malonyl-CoA:ACP transacylase (MAT) domain-containing protein n=1 Tax=Collybiopsis luxurians FD-317 M1 TaxID=944289 RepID=A0A0D0B8E1_9AGAR|nr:hypothetical protein GYMLUDRAFT_253014 [Collybiopsis luxurians FD-317 M1]